MKAVLLMRERHILGPSAFVELVVWRLRAPLPGSRHVFKYRLALVIEGHCVLRYDNESGKGDHRHEGEEKRPYAFSTPERLLDDFWSDVAKRGF